MYKEDEEFRRQITHNIVNIHIYESTNAFGEPIRFNEIIFGDFNALNLYNDVLEGIKEYNSKHEFWKFEEYQKLLTQYGFKDFTPEIHYIKPKPTFFQRLFGE